MRQKTHFQGRHEALQTGPGDHHNTQLADREREIEREYCIQ